MVDDRFEDCDPRKLSTLIDEHHVSPSAPLAEGPGSRIGRYKLLQLIGEGGFGSVFMAEQESPVVRKVAIKVIKLGMDTRQVIARFQAERQALAMMDHPNIAKVLDAGATETGRPYFVMELVKGIPITDYCDQGNLTPRQRLELFLPVCKAVQHAHQKGIIHRDLKPSNILVTLHDGMPVPKVIDFGIAKATNARLTEQTLFTEFRQFIGTPQYTSPEQAELSGLDVDTRSDIYSLGAVLYELLTGETPFDPRELRKAAHDEMRRIIKEVEPPRPSTRLSTMGKSLVAVAAHRSVQAKSLHQLIAGELDWIVMKCLEKDRSRRYETANGLLSDVEKYLNDEPVSACPPSRSYRLRKLIRRNKGKAAAVLAVVASLVLGIIGTSIGLIQARRNLTATREAERREAAQTKQAEAVAVRLETIFRGLDPNNETKGQDVKGQLILQLEETAASLEKDSAGDPTVRARLRNTIAETYMGIGEFEKAVNVLRIAEDELARTAVRDDPQMLRILNNLGNAYIEFERAEEAVRLLEEVRDRRIARLGPNHEDTLSTQISAAKARLDLTGVASESVSLLEDVRARCEKALGPDHVVTLRALNGLAEAYALNDRNEEAIAALKIVRDREVKLFDQDDIRTLDTNSSLAMQMFSHGDSQEALRLLEQVREVAVQKFGERNPHTLNILTKLGQTYLAVGRGPEAITLLENVRNVQTQKLGPQAALTPGFYLCYAYKDAGRIKDATALCEQLLDQANKSLRENHRYRGWIVITLADLYSITGRTAEGITALERALDEHKRYFGPDHPETLLMVLALANAKCAAGRIDEAVALVKSIQGRTARVRDLDHVLELASHLHRAGRSAEASALLDEIFERAKHVEPHDVPSRTLLNNIACTYLELGRRDEAIVLLTHLLDMDVMRAPDRVGLLISIRNLGFAYSESKRFAEAIKYYEQAMVAQERFLGDSDGATLQTTIDLAYAYSKLGRTNEAITLCEKAKEVVHKPFSQSDRIAWQTFRLLGRLYREAERKEDLRKLLRVMQEGLENDVREKTAALTKNPSDPELWAGRGELYARLGRFGEGAEDYAKAVELAPHNHLYWHDGVVPFLLMTGRVDDFRLMRSKELRQFENDLTPVVGHRISKDAFMLPLEGDDLERATVLAGRGHEDFGGFQTKGMAQYRRGRFKEALPLLTQSLKLGEGDENCVVTELFVAMTYKQLGDDEKATANLKSAVHKMDVEFSDPLTAGFPDWVICQVLRREAEELINGKPTTRPAGEMRDGAHD